MKISVIMPVYNAEKYLEKAIESVLAQDGIELEIIAVDDKSTDSSARLLKEIADRDKRVRAFYNDENMGVASVRNFALSKAEGEFLAFCDSDDLLPSGAYAALLSAAEGNDIVSGGYNKMHDNGETFEDILPDTSTKSSAFSTVFTVCSLCTKIIRSSFVKTHEVRFDTDMRIGEDVVFMAKLVSFNPKCAAVDALVYHYCQHNTGDSRSLTHTYSLYAFSKHIECKKRLLEICQNSEEAKEYVYVTSTPYITSFLPLIFPYEEREAAFELYKKFLAEYDFSNQRQLFRWLTGVPYDGFNELSVERFIQIKNSYLPRETVLFEFETGRIGLRWIFSYLKAWVKYKFKKN